MIRNSLYAAIAEALSGPLDDRDQIFEACAVALLRKAHPGIFPMRGGSDGGMDGGIVEGGEVAPLATTVGGDVEGNLKRSLESYRSSGGESSRVYFATSQKLTNPKKKKLKALAANLGFELVVPYDRDYFALALFESPEWRHELLGIPGHPPALSEHPASRRPRPDLPLVGFESVGAQLRALTGDVLVVGQPGSGKTSLLSANLRELGALFVVDQDAERLADALRARRPTCVYVDDAQTTPGLIPTLRRLRDDPDLAFQFRIVATCWPWDRDALLTQLGVAGGQCITLPLLSRLDMLAVIRRADIPGPDLVDRMLLDQSCGRPGLATTLCKLWRDGAWKEVALGSALAREVWSAMDDREDARAPQVLAAFSLGGARGMTLEAVSRHLEVSVADVRLLLARLRLGGVVDQRAGQRFMVQPKHLRFALIREQYFGAVPADWRPLACEAERIDDVLDGLLGARHGGAQVPDGCLMELLVKTSGRTDLWRLFAALGERQVHAVLRHRPDYLVTIAAEALEFNPLCIIPQLLDAADSDPRPNNPAPTHPLRILRDWVESAVPGTPAALTRRRDLSRCVAEWYRAGSGAESEQAVALTAFRAALSHKFDVVQTSAVDAYTGFFRTGAVTEIELDGIGSLWPEILSAIACHPVTDWNDVRLLMQEAGWPPTGVSCSEQWRAIRKAQRARWLADLAPLAVGQNAASYWAWSLATSLGFTIVPEVEPGYRELKVAGHQWSPEWREEAAQRAHSLFERWKAEDAPTLIGRLARYAREERELGINDGIDVAAQAFYALADAVDPGVWADTMMQQDVPPFWLVPFLRALLNSGHDDCTELLGRALDDSQHGAAATVLVLSTPEPPGGLLELAIERVPLLHSDQGTLWHGGHMPDATALRLLAHEDATVRSAAVMGAWTADRARGRSGEVRRAWEAAFVDVGCDEWLTDQVLAAEPSLARLWLSARLDNSGGGDRLSTTACGAIVTGMSIEERIDWLARLSNTLDHWELLRALVGDDPRVYRSVFEFGASLDGLRLAPLEGDPSSPAWAGLALIARENRVSAEEIARATDGFMQTYHGDGVEQLLARVGQFEALRARGEPELSAIVHAGLDWFGELRDRANAEAARIAIYGHNP